MVENWKKIWNNREVSGICLKDRIVASGFDGAFGSISPENWQKYVDMVADKLLIGNADRLLEVGCGCGAFLAAIQTRVPNINGIDYSQIFIENCRLLNPNGFFRNMEAKDLSLISETYDVVISNSVFQYFPDYNYVDNVMDGIHTLLATKGRCAILDLNDIAKKEEFFATREREMGGIDVYHEKYKDTPHLFFNRDYFHRKANEYNYQVEIVDQSIDGYFNSRYRFNVFLWKYQ